MQQFHLLLRELAPQQVPQCLNLHPVPLFIAPLKHLWGVLSLTSEPGQPRKFALCHFLAGQEKTQKTPCLSTISARPHQTPLSRESALHALKHPTPSPPPQNYPTLAPPKAHKLPCRLLPPHQTQPTCEVQLSHSPMQGSKTAFRRQGCETDIFLTSVTRLFANSYWFVAA